jgi:hypothetical protein
LLNARPSNPSLFYPPNNICFPPNFHRVNAIVVLRRMNQICKLQYRIKCMVCLVPQIFLTDANYHLHAKRNYFSCRYV